MGGIGNQLFQIFHGMAIAKRYDMDYIILYNRNEDRSNYMETGNVLDLPWIHKKRKSHGSYENVIYVKESRFGNTIVNLKLYVPPKKIDEIANKNFCLEGYWQNWVHFENIYDSRTIRNLLSFDSVPFFFSSYENTVALHLRFGDYRKFPTIHPILPISYYINALKHIHRKTSTTLHVFICYDNKKEDEDLISQYIQNIDSLDFVELLSLQKNQTERMDMITMSNCDHHIIANSTFSWWSAFLRKNDTEKNIVCAPSIWFGKDWKEAENWNFIYYRDWIVI